MAVLSALYERAGFTSTQELHEALEAKGITVGLTTVYRTLHALNRSGQVDVVRDRTGERLYRPRPADGHRHYLVCHDCGSSAAVDADPVERWADNLAETMGFTEVEHTIELTGVSRPACGRRTRTRNADRGSGRRTRNRARLASYRV
jgi:Fur family ferric uptake transcriptional regulator